MKSHNPILRVCRCVLPLLGWISPVAHGQTGPKSPDSVLGALEYWHTYLDHHDLVFTNTSTYTAAASRAYPHYSGVVPGTQLVNWRRAARSGDRYLFSMIGDSIALPNGAVSAMESEECYDGTGTVVNTDGSYVKYPGRLDRRGGYYPHELVGADQLMRFLRWGLRDPDAPGAPRIRMETRDDEVELTIVVPSRDGAEISSVYTYVMDTINAYIVKRYEHRDARGVLRTEARDIEYARLRAPVRYPVRGTEYLYTREGLLYKTQSFEVDTARSHMGIGPMPDSTFRLNIPEGKKVLTVDPSEQGDQTPDGSSRIDSPCGSNPTQAGTRVSDALPSYRGEVSVSLTKAVEFARKLPPPTMTAHSGVSEPEATGLVQACPAGLEGWRAGAWGGVGALFGVMSMLLGMKLLRFLPGRRGS